MKKAYILFSLLFIVSALYLVGCKDDEETWRNNPPKIAFSVAEEAVQPLDLNVVEKPPTLTGTVQSDAGLQEVVIELIKNTGNVEVESVTTFDEVSGKIYVFSVDPEYTEDLTGLKVKGVDVQNRVVEKTLSITVIEKVPELTFSPASGLEGDEVTLTGFDFQADNIESVMLGDLVIETFNVAEDGSNITFNVPEGAESGLITVNQKEGDPMVSLTEFVVLEKPKELYTFSDVVVNAQADRNDEGVYTAFSAEGERFTLAEGTVEENSEKIDFITADSGGDDGLDLFSPNHSSWLSGNYFEDDDDMPVVWPVLNETQMQYLADKDADFFANATAEDISALSVGSDFKTRIELTSSDLGAIILFVTTEGNKGLLYYKAHDPNAAAGSKADIFTFDIKVLK